jgi:hypothetical protein
MRPFMIFWFVHFVIFLTLNESLYKAMRLWHVVSFIALGALYDLSFLRVNNRLRKIESIFFGEFFSLIDLY